MSSTLYLTDRSPFGARLRIICNLTGQQPYDETTPPDGAGSEAMKQISHWGKMPALAIDDRVLIESIPLMEYLIEKAGYGALMPVSAEDRATMRSIIIAHDMYVMMNAMFPLFPQLRSGKPDPAIVVPALRAGADQYEVLTRLFDPDGGFAIGGRLSLADVALAPFALLFGYAYPMFGEISPFVSNPRLAAWWKLVSAIPQIAKVTDMMAAGLARGFPTKK
jgi:glutathione S-transferase